ncbi:MAG TPA: extracellular solute-binding protein [Candidatus Limnocylindrales bacterium]|jgi:putative spermidine/putrescine transport system substrate-binding protein|nr:extracellular solute-binding protein [Candidatus Limnocylindrales bacterium]
MGRRVARGAVGGLIAVVVAGCSGSAPPASGPASAAPTASQDPAAVIARLEAETRAEGALNSYGMPDDWTNFGTLWATFTAKYGLTHTDTDMSSAEEIQKFDAEKHNPVADIGDIGIQFGPVAVQAGVTECYKATVWDKIPDWAKDPNGCWTGWYTGTISFAVNTAVVPDSPRSWADLLKPEYRGKVAMSDPRTTGQGAMSFLAANLALGGSETDLQPGYEFFKKLADAGNFVPLAPTRAALEKGEVGIGILWDFNALPARDALASTVPIEVVIPSDGTTAAPYVAIINRYGRHKSAAKLFLEYVLSTEGQIIQARKYARPIRPDVSLPADLEAKWPPASAYASVKPITDWVKAAEAIESLATDWTITVGQDS